MSTLSRQQGFTLIEVLAVMLVLVAIATITVESSKDFVFQNRYQVTQDRYDKIKQAIIGNPNQVVNGQPNIEGFVKDVGRLPFNLQELTNGNPKIYLSATDLTDGWGNTATDATDLNYGWYVVFFDNTGKPTIIPANAVSMNIQSKGKNGCINGSTNSAGVVCTDAQNIYDADYPAFVATSPSIKATDWRVNVTGIQASIMTSSISGNCLTAPQNTDECTKAGGTWYTSPFPPVSPAICLSDGGTWYSSQPTNQTACSTLNGVWNTTQPTDSTTCASLNGTWNVLQPTDQATCSSEGGVWSTTQPTDQTTCTSEGGTWDNTTIPPSCSGATGTGSCSGATGTGSCSGITLPSCSGASVPACVGAATVPFCSNLVTSPKLGCDLQGKTFIYNNSDICMKITDKRFPASPINSIPISIPEDGREHLISFTFSASPQYIPLGSVFIGIYKFTGGTCSTTPYGRTSSDIQINLFPNASLPAITW